MSTPSSRPGRPEPAVPQVYPQTGVSTAPVRRRATPRSVARADRLARWAISAGGLLVVVTVVGMLVFILSETWPLFRRAEVAPAAGLDAGARGAGVDPYHSLVWTVGPDPVFRSRAPESGAPRAAVPLAGLQAPVTAVWRASHAPLLAAGDDQGRVWLGRLSFRSSWDEGDRRIDAALEPLGEVAELGPGAVRAVAATTREDAEVVAALLDAPEGARVRLRTTTITRDIFGEATREVRDHDLGRLAARPTALTLSPDGRTLWVGTQAGAVHVYAVEADGPRPLERFEPDGTPVSALGLLGGGRSVAVGTTAGSVEVWARAGTADRGRVWQRLHALTPHDAPVSAIASSSRTRNFATGDAEGRVLWHHATAETSAGPFLAGEGAVRSLEIAAKSDGWVAVLEDGRVAVWQVDDPHPEATAGTIFGAVWYEGYREPRHVWQSSAGTDTFEPKLSVIPLVWGTLKGAFWAMIFATPVALLAAIYSAVFLHPRLRRVVKPAVEVMASLPSVVLGFLAALWLAPIVERSVPAFLAALLLLPAAAVATAFAWNALPRQVRGRLPPWVELTAVLLSVVLAAGAAALLGPALESVFFGGDFQRWVQVDAGIRYEQRNALVVGIAMGFAVIPIIYTLADDSLAAVPQSLKSASLACGASRWQTALRVVIPTAAPGLFSAVMIGLGRAVGETMIVLMATGNTPVMDFLPFTGFRAMSANIAVELPEAPHGGTLYRVLFLTALLLFVTTFVLNTAAEIVRQRLRKRYRAY